MYALGHPINLLSLCPPPTGTFHPTSSHPSIHFWIARSCFLLELVNPLVVLSPRAFGSLSRFFGECRYDGIDSVRYAAHDGAMAPFAARAPIDNKEIGIVARLLLWSGGKKRRIGREKTHTEEGPARLEVSLVFIVRARKICKVRITDRPVET